MAEKACNKRKVEDVDGDALMANGEAPAVRRSPRLAKLAIAASNNERALALHLHDYSNLHILLQVESVFDNVECLKYGFETAKALVDTIDKVEYVQSRLDDFNKKLSSFGLEKLYILNKGCAEYLAMGTIESANNAANAIQVYNTSTVQSEKPVELFKDIPSKISGITHLIGKTRRLLNKYLGFRPTWTNFMNMDLVNVKAVSAQKVSKSDVAELADMFKSALTSGSDAADNTIEAYIQSLNLNCQDSLQGGGRKQNGKKNQKGSKNSKVTSKSKKSKPAKSSSKSSKTSPSKSSPKPKADPKPKTTRKPKA